MMAERVHSKYLRSDERVHFKESRSDNGIQIHGSTDSKVLLRVSDPSGADIRKRARTPLDQVTDTNTGSSKGFLYDCSPVPTVLYITDQRLLLIVGRDSDDIVIEFSYDEATIQPERTYRARYNYVCADKLTYAFQIWPSDHYAAEKYVTKQVKRGQLDRKVTERATLFEDQTIPDSILKNRVKDVVAATEGTPPLTGVWEDYQLAREWLNVWARWESLRTIEETPRSDITVSDISGVGETLAANLTRNGYETFSEIRAGTSTRLMKVENIGKRRAKNLHERVCYRPLGQISGITAITESQLNLRGFKTAADITAVPTETLTEVSNITKKQASTIQAQAAAWLPESNGLPDEVKQHYAPPFGDLETAKAKLDELEALIRHQSGAEVFTVSQKLAKTDKEIDNEKILERCLSEDEVDDPIDATATMTWLDVLKRLAILSEDTQVVTLPDPLKDKFDLTTLDSVSVETATVLGLPLAEAAERVTEAERAMAARSKFVRAVFQAESVLEQASTLSLNWHDQLKTGITTQIHFAHESLNDRDSAEVIETVLQYTFACGDAVEAAGMYPDEPFSEIITALGELGKQSDFTADEVNELDRIVTISKRALDKLGALSYDHPAIDRGSWRESITLALNEQYQPAIEPIAKQLDRMQGGIWKTSDLHAVDWRAFEKLIGDLFREDGFDVNVTQSNADLGVDIWAHDEQEDIAIQVKQFQVGQPVGRETLQKLVSTLAKGDADRAVVVTSSEFADTAEQYATDFGTDLKLIDGDEIVQRLSESSIPPSNNKP